MDKELKTMVKPSLFVNKASFLSPQQHGNSLFGGIHTTNSVSVSNCLKVSVKKIRLPCALEVKGEGKAMHAKTTVFKAYYIDDGNYVGLSVLR